LHCSTVGAEGVIAAKNRVSAEQCCKHNARVEAACLIKRSNSPGNIVGGHKFFDTPTVDLAPTPQRSVLTPEHLQRLNDPFFQIPDDLSIPAFLKREPGS
jgi:hypothetical protein